MSSVGSSKECAICGTSDAQLIRTCQSRRTFISECIATTFRDDDVRIRPQPAGPARLQDRPEGDRV